MDTSAPPTAPQTAPSTIRRRARRLAYIAVRVVMACVIGTVAHRVLSAPSSSDLSPAYVISVLNRVGVTCTDAENDYTNPLPGEGSFASCRPITSTDDGDRFGVSTFDSEEECTDSYLRLSALLRQRSLIAQWVLKSPRWYALFGVDQFSAQQAQRALGGELSNVGRDDAPAPDGRGRQPVPRYWT
ncbi:hypothetical protein [Streptosporangium saharense]|uniref:hypothetical protein n=1 Tax=Streptosporangium saharense TaxID=1706840 RepID=UPI00331FC90C